MSAPDWIAVDWGTTNLRAWAMSNANAVLQTAQSDQGMGKLSPDGFEPALMDLIGDWVKGPATVVACGMVGARQGWIEADYVAVPAPANATSFTTAPTKTPGLSVHIVPGLSQSAPADVMRGEETQIAGFLAQRKNWDGVIVLPGTHTKWALVSADEVVSFQTFMTGDLFAALSGHTVLRHSIAESGWDQDAFLEALDDALSRPDKLAARLFSLRAEGLLHGLTGETARARLSGALIGAELAAAKPYWLGQRLAVVGSGPAAEAYVSGLATQGVVAETADTTETTLNGLKAAYATLRSAA